MLRQYDGTESYFTFPPSEFDHNVPKHFFVPEKFDSIFTLSDDNENGISIYFVFLLTYGDFWGLDNDMCSPGSEGFEKSFAELTPQSVL